MPLTFHDNPRVQSNQVHYEPSRHTHRDRTRNVAHSICKVGIVNTWPVVKTQTTRSQASGPNLLSASTESTSDDNIISLRACACLATRLNRCTFAINRYEILSSSRTLRSSMGTCLC